VRGGAKGILRRRREIDELLKGTDHEGLDLLPADFSYRNMDLVLDGGKATTRRLQRLVAPLRQQYDLVFLDCPPSISLVSENVFHAADALLVPLIPTTLSLRTLEQLERFVRDHDVKVDILPFFSMVDRRKALHREIVATLADRHPQVLLASIPSATEVERMGLHRDAVCAFAPGSRVANAYEQLWGEVRGRLAV
jgi:cellulose biosynthesis protein BcsQ